MARRVFVEGACDLAGLVVRTDAGKLLAGGRKRPRLRALSSFAL